MSDGQPPELGEQAPSSYGTGGWDYRAIREPAGRGTPTMTVSARLPEDVHEAVLDMVQGPVARGFKSVSQFVQWAVLNALAFQHEVIEPSTQVGMTLMAQELNRKQRERNTAEQIIHIYEELFRAAAREGDSAEMAELLSKASVAADRIPYKKWRDRLLELVEKHQ